MFESRYLDGQLFKECNFIEAFIVVDLRNFVSKVPQEIIPSLVRLLYSNLKYSNDILTTQSLIYLFLFYHLSERCIVIIKKGRI